MFASDQPTWQNPRILTTLVLVFLTGAMAGAIGMRPDCTSSCIAARLIGAAIRRSFLTSS
jgi:hypothetical protein